MQELFLANLVGKQLVLSKQGSEERDFEDVLEDLADCMQPSRVDLQPVTLSLSLFFYLSSNLSHDCGIVRD